MNMIRTVNTATGTTVLVSWITVITLCQMMSVCPDSGSCSSSSPTDSHPDDHCQLQHTGQMSNKYSSAMNEATSKFLREVEQAELTWFATIKEIKSTTSDDEDGDNATHHSQCTLFLNVIDEDLIPFLSGVTKSMIQDAAEDRGTLYQVVDKKLYREDNCKFPARCAGVEHFLLTIVDELPDLELVINVSDWPQVPSWSQNPVPVFSFSKTSAYLDVRYPAWAFWEGGPAISIYPKGIGRWDLSRKKLLVTAGRIPWKDKVDKGFFRGSRTSSERDALIYLSRSLPDLVDAKYTKNQAWKSDADTLHEPAATEVTFENHCNYKYLFNFRGVAASFRYKHLFLCNSLVFHVGNEWTEFFYSGMKPWIHYIPVDSQASKEEIQSLLEFAKTHEELSQRIANRGFEFIRDHLTMKSVTCYWKRLLFSYAKLLNYRVQRRPDLHLII